MSDDYKKKKKKKTDVSFFKVSHICQKYNDRRCKKMTDI